MKATFFPSVARGEVCAPPSKSVAHRLLVACALSDGQSVIRGISQSEDMLATLSCVRALGAKAKTEGSASYIQGCKKAPLENAVFDCNESGSTLRFFLPVVLALGAKNCTFKGTARLIQRGIGVYDEVFAQNGVKVQKEADTITVWGRLASGNYTVRGDVSSQYITGLLIALSLLDEDSTITVIEPFESRAYVDITVDVMKKCGVDIQRADKNVFVVKGGQRFKSGNYTVEGDWSNSAFLLAFNYIGGEVQVEGLAEDSVQGDKVCKRCFEQLECQNAVIDVSDCPDLAPILFAVSAMKSGATFVGTRRLKIKESDRAETMAEELSKYGIKADIQENSVTIYGGNLHAPNATISGHNDHRIVMANAVILSKVGGTIDGIEAVKKSYPNFFEDIAKLGVKYEID